MDITQKRWSFIVNLLYFSIIVAAFLLFMKYAFWTVSPFLVAILVAALLQKPLKRITASKRISKGVAGTLLSLLVFSVLVGIVALIGMRLGVLVKDWIDYFTAKCSNMADLFEFLKTEFLNLKIAQTLPTEAKNSVLKVIDLANEYVTSGKIMSVITSNFSTIIAPIGNVLMSIPSFLISFVVCIIATCFMTASFDNIKSFIINQFDSEKQIKIRKAKKIILSSVGKMFKAYGSIILITTAELIIGLGALTLLGIYKGGHIFVISVIIAIVDIVPVLGTGTVVLPWSVYSFITGNIGMGIGLIVIYALITVIRQVIEPKLVAGQVGISPVVTIISMFLGAKIFGAMGIFILPFIVIIIKLLNDEGIIHLFKPAKETRVDEVNYE